MANTCTGDCLKCSFQQQVYCAAQRSYAAMNNQRVIVEALGRMEAALASLTVREIIPIDNKAQNSDGAENRPEQPDNNTQK